MRGPVNGDVPALGPDDCQVWWARLDYCASWHRQFLNPAECQRRERYLRDSDRDRFTLGVALSRLILAAHLQVAPADLAIDRSCPRCGQPHGRPRLASGAPLDFSVSHSGDLIAVAIAPDSSGDSGPGRSVGVDVERVAPLSEPPRPDVMLSAAERITFGRLGATAQVTAFFRYWVRKEAVLKATGHGLSVPLTRLTVSGPDRPPRLRGWTGRPAFAGPVTLHDLAAAPGYAASLAVVGRAAAVTERDAISLVLQP